MTAAREKAERDRDKALEELDEARAKVGRAQKAYYWSTPWQRDLREAMEAYARGDVEVFDSDDPNDVVRWLHENILTRP